jgi:hypothetical protein
MRHVRVHHVEKDRGDPLLRRILAQRPEGPLRGRRRRLDGSSVSTFTATPSNFAATPGKDHTVKTSEHSHTPCTPKCEAGPPSDWFVPYVMPLRNVELPHLENPDIWLIALEHTHDEKLLPSDPGRSATERAEFDLELAPKQAQVAAYLISCLDDSETDDPGLAYLQAQIHLCEAKDQLSILEIRGNLQAAIHRSGNYDNDLQLNSLGPVEYGIMYADQLVNEHFTSCVCSQQYKAFLDSYKSAPLDASDSKSGADEMTDPRKSYLEAGLKEHELNQGHSNRHDSASLVDGCKLESDHQLHSAEAHFCQTSCLSLFPTESDSSNAANAYDQVGRDFKCSLCGRVSREVPNSENVQKSNGHFKPCSNTNDASSEPTPRRLTNSLTANGPIEIHTADSALKLEQSDMLIGQASQEVNTLMLPSLRTSLKAMSAEIGEPEKNSPTLPSFSTALAQWNASDDKKASRHSVASIPSHSPTLRPPTGEHPTPLFSERQLARVSTTPVSSAYRSPSIDSLFSPSFARSDPVLQPYLSATRDRSLSRMTPSEDRFIRSQRTPRYDALSIEALSDGERSFMTSANSDELSEEWECNLDPVLELLRSKLVESVISSYLDTAVQQAIMGTESIPSTHISLCTEPFPEQPAKIGGKNACGSGSGPGSETSRVQSSDSTEKATTSSATSIGKHSRPLDEISEEIQENSGGPVRKKRRVTITSISTDGRLLACPYCKYDPARYSERNITEKNYRGCSSMYLTTISRLKQHLYRSHKRPDHYCLSCFQVYKSQSLLSAHTRTRPACELRAPLFEERMTFDQARLIKRRAVGKSLSDTWFDIFKILFPGSPLPDSPFVDSVSSEAVHRFADHFYRQARARLTHLVHTELEGLILLEIDQQRILDSALERAIAQIVWQSGPYRESEEMELDSPEADVQEPQNETATPDGVNQAIFPPLKQLSATDIIATANDSLADHRAIGQAWNSASRIAPEPSTSDPPEDNYSISRSPDPQGKDTTCVALIFHDGADIETMRGDSQGIALQVDPELLTADEWAAIESSIPAPDTFGWYMSVLAGGTDFDAMPQQAENSLAAEPV